MAKLTPEDKENYRKLAVAFAELKVVDMSGTAVAENSELDSILSEIRSKINIFNIGQVPESTEDISSNIDVLSIYLGVIFTLGNDIVFVDPPVTTQNQNTNENFKQQFSDAIENLKRSLKVVEDEEIDLTDEVENFQPDNLFLSFVDTAYQGYTQILINDRDPNLQESDINELTQAWGTAVDKFVRDARNSEEPGEQDTLQPGNLTTFASFFRIHKELEILYSRLADSETVQLA
jgi:hypothetical protein